MRYVDSNGGTWDYDLPKITIQLVLQTLREVVAEKGEDYVYPEDHRRRTAGKGGNLCQYVDVAGEVWVPDCIVGAVLAKLGVPLELLHLFEGAPGGYVAQQTLGLTHADAISTFLTSAQGSQDDRETWGDALRAAEQFFM